MKPVFTSKLFKLAYEHSTSRLICEFKTRQDADLFLQTDFSSKILTSFIPDNEGVWRPGNRTNYEIVGWPKSYVWRRNSQNQVESTIQYDATELKLYGELLETIFPKIKARQLTDDGEYYQFSIAGNGENYAYSFNDRARVIAALCVLYDLEPHNRNHLELNIPFKYVKYLKWPLQNIEDDTVVRFYGDPSKTADVLRNEGWSREGDTPHMFVYRENINGQQQQMYRLDTREQTLEQQVKRTVIKNSWRKELFKSQDYTCRICRLKYDEEQLSPDHRVPVIFEADNLNDDNFKDKLMTLCRFCNQQKREFTKRIDASYDWSTSQWAYPETFMLKSASKIVSDYAKFNDIAFKQAVELLDPDV